MRVACSSTRRAVFLSRRCRHRQTARRPQATLTLAGDSWFDMSGLDYRLADLSFARRLERAEALSNVDFVEARARVSPDVGAAWIEVAGSYAMFDGASSPLTQTFGIGMFAPLTAADLNRIEQFYEERRAPVHHEFCPLADVSALTMLNARRYAPIEFTSVMARPIQSDHLSATVANPRIIVRPIAEDEHERWAQTAARGWSEIPELGTFMLALALVNAARKHAVSFIAEQDGRAIATGALSLQDGVALLAGASTVPAGRKQGAQRALLESRLQYAAKHGCDVAMMCAQPGSASQRNAEREGFRIAYTRIKFARPLTSNA